MSTSHYSEKNFDVAKPKPRRWQVAGWYIRFFNDSWTLGYNECNSSADCVDGYMCTPNYDYEFHINLAGYEGVCEPCSRRHQTEEACRDGWISDTAIQECLSACVVEQGKFII